MRLWIRAVTVAVAIAAGGAHAVAAAPVAQCPSTFSPATKLPAGARQLGTPPATPYSLWLAVPSIGRPADIDAEGTLSDDQADDERRLRDGGVRYIWGFGGSEPYLLACRYAADRATSLTVTAGSVLLLLPLPEDMRGECAVTYGPAKGKKAAPVKSAVCTVGGP